MWRRWFPLLDQLRGYDRRTAMRDVQAGVVVSALLIPAGIGYAAASGLPPITGLYATIVPLVVYALAGPSRILIYGPDSSLTPLIAGLVIPLSHGDPGGAVALAGVLTLLAGALCLLAGVARFGFLADLLSKPVRFGYLNGIALTVIAGQLPRALGFSGQSETFVGEVRVVWRGLRDGHAAWWPFGIAAVGLATMLVVRRIDRRVPASLVVVVGAIVTAVVFDLDRKGVALLGTLPRGFPSPHWPGIPADDLPRVLAVAVGVAFVSFADSSVLSRTYALKRGEPVDPNHEMLALGAVNVASGFFQGFPVSSSQSRTPAAEDAGAQTQMTGLVAAVVVSVMILVAPGVLKHLPAAALAAVVMAAAMRLVEVDGVLRLWGARRSEFVLSIVAFSAVAVFGPVQGIGVAIGLSLLNFMRQAWRPYTTELVRVTGLKGYHDVLRHPEGRRIPSLLLYRFDAPLFFANGPWFEQDVLARLDRPGCDAEWVVVTAEPITDIDSTAADSLSELLDRLDERGVILAFAELKGHVRDRLDAYGLVDRIGRDRFYRTVGEAVHVFVRETGAPWRDWQDEDAGGLDGASDGGAKGAGGADGETL